MKYFFLLSMLCFISFSQRTLAQNKVIFMSTEQDAEFPGGEEAMLTYLSEKINYPQEAFDNGISGTVYATFVVNANGSIEQIDIMRDIGGGCGKEVTKVIQGMPHWKPAQNNGTAVRSYYTLPVQFMPPPKKSRKKKRVQDRLDRKRK